MRILLVEDDPEISRYIRKGLMEAGHQADVSAEGREGLFMATSEAYDAVILDRMLPQMDGLSVLAALRASGSSVPVLILSALGTVDERVKGLRAGSDDYVVKPVVMSELLARLEAITRRRVEVAMPSNELQVADLALNRLTREVCRDGQTILLKPQEYRVLEYLMRHVGQVVTRTMLLEGVWDYHFDPQTNVIDVHMSRLRSKIDEPRWPALIHTVRGVGYCLRAPT